jgi:prepilin-type N-terminal cleavage/methylation domain-containing protein
MKTNLSRKPTRSAFTLIEMIGVLAVIAILAALLIPKVFAAINSAKVSNTSTSLNTVKTAAIDHYAKFGNLNVDGSVTPPVPLTAAQQDRYDQVLLKEQFLDKLFAVKIGDGTTNTLVRLSAAVAVATAADGSNAAYNLDGDAIATPANDAGGTHVLEAVISGVTLADARDLNRIIDGTDPDLGESVATPGSESDVAGRVKYTMAAGVADVLVYLTHR